ncbi:MAG: DNA repair protein RadC [Deltaproteobacteria bacterium]|nr:DNA repair protein RadC [Deltaproteobacteria bacterium]
MPKDVYHYVGHRKRLRERFRSAGRKGLADYELLELLLTYALPRKDIKPMAKQIIAKYGSLANILDLDMDELESNPGIGEYAATLIRLVKECMVAYLEPAEANMPLLNTPQKLYDYIKVEIGNTRKECFMVVCLDAGLHLLRADILTTGTTDHAHVYPREVIRYALSNNASGLILVHNHPSGTMKPSSDDIKLTERLKEIASPLGISIHDHLIVTRQGVFSIRESRCIY